MKTVLLTCDGCGFELKNTSAAVTLFEGPTRRDFCTDWCFTSWAIRGRAPENLELRPARPQDSKLIWQWANDQTTRRQSFSSGFIGWEEHSQWFDAQSDLQVGWVPVGSTRINDGEISVNVAPEQRRRGYAKQLIAAATLPNTRARIKDTNFASLRAFKSAGYTEISHDDNVVELVWTGLC